jgi:hypothetical protein
MAGDDRLLERFRSEELLPIGSRMRVRLAIECTGQTSKAPLAGDASAAGSRRTEPDQNASVGFPKRSAIFEQALPKHEQGHESRQHQRCDHHLNDGETGCVFA